MTTSMFRGREHDGLNYHSDSSSAPSIENFRQTEDHDSTPWQLIPPIVTGGRIAAVRPPMTPPDTGEIFSQAPQPMPAHNDAPLFRVSFAGPDQQWYQISIGTQQAQQNLLASPPATWSVSSRVVTPEASPRVTQARPRISSPQQPLWQEEERSTWGGVREKWQQGVRPGLPPAEQASRQDDRLVRPLGTSPVQRPIRPEAAQPITPQLEDTKKNFLLQIVQPGLAGLMDGSVSTLAPIFAVAFATHQSFTVFLVGMASALGAGISMTFSEALSDDGEITGRGSPLLRGGVTGLMTFLSGAGHAFPFLIPNIQLALLMAYAVVALELLAIAAIRHKYFGTKWWLSIVQVVGGGLLVFLTALLLGNA